MIGMTEEERARSHMRQAYEIGADALKDLVCLMAEFEASNIPFAVGQLNASADQMERAARRLRDEIVRLRIRSETASEQAAATMLKVAAPEDDGA